MSGLYIHVPFCERKCSYCAFYSVDSTDETRIGSFFDSLKNELDSLPNDFSPETIFIGGGTPSAPDFKYLEEFFPLFRRFSPQEFSVEVNPGSGDEAKLSLFKGSGVNRLSIGVQSFNSDCLDTLGRIHSAEEAEHAFHLARRIGFDNISIDLMFGTPGQTLAMLEEDLERVIALGPEHVAIYNLMYEEGTPMAARQDRLDEDLEREMYDLIRARLAAAGFEHYEISNFAKPGFECQHNLLYWTGGEYIGCGPAAHSHWSGTRWANVSDLDDYCANGPRREFEETLDADEKERETLVMGLRLLRGVDVGHDLFERKRSLFQRLATEGLLVIDGRRVRLSEDALFVSDSVLAELV